MKITTWNILAPIWTRHYFSNEELIRKYIDIEKRRPIILKNLKRLDSHIFLLQEVQESEVPFIKEHLGNYHMFFVPHKKSHWDYFKMNRWQPNGTAILFKKGLFKKYTVKSVKIHPNGNVAALLIAGEYIFVTLHLSERTSTGIKQLRALLKYLQKYSQKYVIIGGDFNNSTIYEDLSELKTFHKDHNIDTCIEKGYRCSLDHIFYKGLQGKIINYPMTDYLDILERYGSDHVPVTLNF